MHVDVMSSVNGMYYIDSVVFNEKIILTLSSIADRKTFWVLYHSDSFSTWSINGKVFFCMIEIQGD